jgi:hypothetical protein
MAILNEVHHAFLQSSQILEYLFKPATAHFVYTSISLLADRTNSETGTSILKEMAK